RTLDRMQAAGETDGIIVVGIDNGGDHRISEYSPSIDPRAIKRIEKHFKGIALVAEGGAYGDWLVGTLKPSIDARYRTLPAQATTGIAGSSCGGNIALSIVLAHPDRFGVVGVFSPAIWVIAPDVFRRLKRADLPGVRVYHDMGGREEKGLLASLALVLSSLRLDRALKRRLPARSVMRRFDPVARHTELFWQDRFPEFVRWGFPIR
ncbi:MAG: alpha/beta hydrolase-fold protein, partial [Bacillota bacterium]|nr:alpha/beta hydrolase-fold protein [Bacillota bacterium]